MARWSLLRGQSGRLNNGHSEGNESKYFSFLSTQHIQMCRICNLPLDVQQIIFDKLISQHYRFQRDRHPQWFYHAYHSKDCVRRNRFLTRHGRRFTCSCKRKHFQRPVERPLFPCLDDRYYPWPWVLPATIVDNLGVAWSWPSRGCMKLTSRT